MNEFCFVSFQHDGLFCDVVCQLINFVRFCELVVSKCRNLKFVTVTTVKDSNSARVADQITAFDALTTDLKKRNITLSVEYSEQLHDRQIM